ncbi:uncharacterized protein PV09_06053 [Verruconis gallopava]|uniref:Capsule synthesis protein CapA domain-containing protein n=1 Tax=Verruconis gallopava TaxID=253628 RepID=A0A0D2AU04_9PEZI|nr:uncharacterized protein PV09_06053 [Verruconis gallopava]KIW02604.1 hypothetical protein PV09_06053 [Verruconis gallopava]
MALKMVGKASGSSRLFRLNFTGDVMLGRLIDGLFATNVANAEDRSHCDTIRERHPRLRDYNAQSPWGSTLPLFRTADLNLINLETAVTTSDDIWPNKVFNYRAHPQRVQCLQEAKISYAGLANNHTLDFGVAGLEETVRCLGDAHIASAGAGLDAHEATRPATLRIRGDMDNVEYQIHVFAASDHPHDWGRIPGFHLIDYTSATRQRLKKLLMSYKESEKPDLKVFSVHWGPNYSWHPSDDIRSLAHFLIDECEVDIIHGHSSHHIQGVELYKGKLIIYGCGDFVDDYALNATYRNDRSAVWTVLVEPSEQSGLRLTRLEIWPTMIEKFQAMVAYSGSEEHRWVCNKIITLSRDLGTSLGNERGDQGQLLINVN